jgi:hypothetical protein
MANHNLVRWSLDQIAAQFEPSVVSTDTPILVDGDDGSVYELERGLTAIGDTRVGSESQSADGPTVVGTAATGTATVGAIPDYQASGSTTVGDAAVGTTLGGRSRVGRKTTIDLADVVSVTVDPSPDRSEEPIGTEYDLRVEDGVNVLIEGVHADEWGQIDDPDTFQALVNEVKRALLDGRKDPPDSQRAFEADYHTIVPANAGRPPGSDKTDYFAYSFDLQFRGYQAL